MVNVKKPEENTGRDRERDKTLSGVLGTTSLVCLALAALLPARESSRLFHVWLPLGLSILAVLALYLSFVYALGWPPARSVHSGRGRRARGVVAALAVTTLLAAAGISIRVFGVGPEPAKPEPAKPAPAGAVLAATLTAPGGAMIGNSYAPVMSQDGKYVAAAGAAAERSGIYIWGIAADGKSPETINLPSDGVAIPCAFTPDDKDLIAISYDSKADKSLIYSIPLPAGQAKVIDSFDSSDQAAVSGDGSIFAFLSAKGDQIDLTNLLTMKSDGFVQLEHPESLVPGSLRLDGNGNELIISNTKGTAYVIGLEGSEQSPLTSAVPYDYAANGSLPVLSPDGSTVLVPTVGGGWKLGSVRALLAPVNPVTPPDSHWPKENGSVLFSSDSSPTDIPVILTFPDNGDTYDLWSESTHALMQNFTIPGTESPEALFLGAGGRQLVLGVGTADNSEYTQLSVYNTPLG